MPERASGRRPATTTVVGHQQGGDRADPGGWPLVAAAGLAVFMAMLDTYVVTVALPSIGGSFGVGPAGLQWVVLAYFLPMAALALPTGRWLDGAGHRAAFLLAVGGFAAASLACALTGSLGVLLIARAAQGVFAAMLTALTPVLVTVAVRPEVRGRAMSVVATLGPLGALSGPALGGWLTEAAGWRALFLINVPIGAVLAVLAVRALPAGARLRWPGRSWVAEAVLLGGAVLAVVGALTLTVQAGAGWLALTVIAVPLLGLWRRLPTSAALLAVARARPVRGGVLALALASTGTSAVVYLVPFFLTRQAGTSPGGIGLALAALPLAMVVLGPLGGLLADRVGAHRVALAGAVVVVAGLVLLLPLSTAWGAADLAWRLAVVGAGMAVFVGPNQTRIMSAAPPSSLATAGGASGLARSLGFGLGPALVTAAWAGAGYTPAGMRLAVVLTAAAALGAVVALALTGPRSSRRATAFPGRAKDAAS
ncbi:MFS transporter [Blastococcus xanthinilyticus]|uniref:MFS transporter n=1 Tax=Blastococcus xanthinilyticus TaxID=1564164 RepID=UPI001412659A|nr:MFS transporter [Blastococcus xanthinilyticus]